MGFIQRQIYNVGVNSATSVAVVLVGTVATVEIQLVI